MSGGAEALRQRYLQWDVVNWSRALDYWLEVCGASAFQGADVLELGAREGGLSLWFADRGARRVVCSDLECPSAAARDLHARAGVSDRIEYAAIDAAAIGRHAEYDIVAMKSVLVSVGGFGGRDAQARTVESVHAALKPGGLFLYAENLAASPMHTYLRRRFRAWGAAVRYLEPTDMDDFLRPFSTHASRSLGFAGLLGQSERQRRLLGYLDSGGLDRIVPDRWHYITAGVAVR